MKRANCGLFFLLLAATAAAAADPPPSTPAPDTVTVEAERQRKFIQQQISSFVTAITIPSFDEALLRWHSPICPATVGLPREKGEYFLARLSQAADEAGVPLAPENCTTFNLLVLASSKPDEIWRRWWRVLDTTNGVTGVNRFMSSKQPIRAFYNANELGCIVAAYKVRRSSKYFPTHCTGGIGSRLSWDVVRDINSVIVMVDLTQVSSLTNQQLADYITMIGLLQVRDKPNPVGSPTILHLFDTGTGQVTKPDGLSAWDRAFLKALYGTNSDSAVQVSQMETRMYEDLVP